MDLNEQNLKKKKKQQQKYFEKDNTEQAEYTGRMIRDTVSVG